MKTNIGEMPLEDYLEIVALQHGFDSYEDLRYNGFVVDIQEEIAKNKTPSPKH